MAPAVRADSAAQSTVNIVGGGNEGKCPDLPGPAKRTLFVPLEEDEPVVKEKPNIVLDPNIISSALKFKEERNQALLSICFKTLELSAKNRQLQKDLTELREQTRKFVESVKENPRAPLVTTATSSNPLFPLPTPVQQPATFLSPTLLNLAYLSPTLYNPFLLKSLGVSNEDIASGIHQAKILGYPGPTSSSLAAPETKTKEDCCSTINWYSNNNSTNNNNNNNTTAQGPLCSCCSEDESRANVAYYKQINGLAQSWINSLIIRGSKAPTKSIEESPKTFQNSGQKRSKDLKFGNGANKKRFKSSTTHSLFGSMSPSNYDESPSSPSSSSRTSSSPISSLGTSTPPLRGSSGDPFIRGADSGDEDDNDDEFIRQFECSEDEES